MGMKPLSIYSWLPPFLLVSSEFDKVGRVQERYTTGMPIIYGVLVEEKRSCLLVFCQQITPQAVSAKRMLS